MHTKTLARFLNIDHSKIFSVIVFWGDCEFKTELPVNVRRNAFVEYIKRKKQILISKEEMNQVCRKLRIIKESTLDEDRREHGKLLSNANKCPRCGGELKQRIVKRGTRAGTKFLGCSNFPDCDFSRNLESTL